MSQPEVTIKVWWITRRLSSDRPSVAFTSVLYLDADASLWTPSPQTCDHVRQEAKKRAQRLQCVALDVAIGQLTVSSGKGLVYEPLGLSDIAYAWPIAHQEWVEIIGTVLREAPTFPWFWEDPAVMAIFAEHLGTL